jgi:hypothetical protein
MLEHKAVPEDYFRRAFAVESFQLGKKQNPVSHQYR